MLRSLRNRLILSHILPMVILISFMGVALIYVLETQFLFPRLRDDLAGVAGLLAEITQNQPDLWDDPNYAQNILRHLQPSLATRVMLIAPDGQLIASSDPADSSRLNQPLAMSGLDEVKEGEVVKRTVYSEAFQGKILDVLAPVYDDNQQLIGILRLSYHFDSIPEEILRLRFLIGAILAAALLMGSGLGYFLALNISQPLQKVTQAIYDVALGDRQEPLPVDGAEEIDTLVRAVNYLNARLHNLEQARRQLLANLVHELGRPLGAFRSGLQALRRGAKDDPELSDELLEGMEGEVTLLQNLLEDLSHLHGQVLGPLELERKAVALSEWLPKVIRPWQEVAQEKRLHWEASIPRDLPVIQADPVRLDQVIGNLASNAIKYTPVGGEIAISAGADREGMVWVQVSDTGPGVPFEEQEKIFEPFYRGDQNRRIKQGLGLGLSIARDLASAHGGRIELDSTPGLGSQFTLYLPVASSRIDRKAESSPRAVAASQE